MNYFSIFKIDKRIVVISKAENTIDENFSQIIIHIFDFKKLYFSFYQSLQNIIKLIGFLWQN